jgi:hypothetical protein
VALQALESQVAALDASPNTGDLIGANAKVIAARKEKLVDENDKLSRPLLAGDLAHMKIRLGHLRALADGDPRQADWVQGQAAVALTSRIDALAKLLSSPVIANNTITQIIVD